MLKTCSQEVSVFVFEKKTAEKLHKPKRKETVAEVLRGSVRQLERFRHPKILQVRNAKRSNTFMEMQFFQVVHPVEECGDTLAFASEPVLASLANILAYQDSTHPSNGPGQGPPPPRPAHAREYHFLDLELKYGLLQVRCRAKRMWVKSCRSSFQPLSVAVDRTTRGETPPLQCFCWEINDFSFNSLSQTVKRA